MIYQENHNEPWQYGKVENNFGGSEHKKVSDTSVQLNEV